MINLLFYLFIYLFFGVMDIFLYKIKVYIWIVRDSMYIFNWSIKKKEYSLKSLYSPSFFFFFFLLFFFFFFFYVYIFYYYYFQKKKII